MPMNIDPVAAVGTGLGAAANLFGINRKRNNRDQIEQQGKLNELGVKSSKELADYNRDLMMRTWEETGYGAQVDQAKKAGLSIAGLYGSGGGGSGATVSAGGGGMGGGSAADSAAISNSNANQGMAVAQLGLLNAQKENIEADTENKKAGAGKAVAETTGVGIENRGKEVDVSNKEMSKDELRDGIIGEAKSKSVKGVVDDMTQKQQIDQRKADLVATQLTNTLTTAKTGLTIQQTNTLKEAVAQAWRDLAIKGREMTRKELWDGTAERLANKGISLKEEGLAQKTTDDAIGKIIMGGAASGKGGGGGINIHNW